MFKPYTFISEALKTHKTSQNEHQLIGGLLQTQTH